MEWMVYRLCSVTGHVRPSATQPHPCKLELNDSSRVSQERVREEEENIFNRKPRFLLILEHNHQTSFSSGDFNNEFLFNWRRSDPCSAPTTHSFSPARLSKKELLNQSVSIITPVPLHEGEITNVLFTSRQLINLFTRSLRFVLFHNSFFSTCLTSLKGSLLTPSGVFPGRSRVVT